ncbi:hypothetical protein Glove_51g50 [Diversispora epigaea]|uniref:Uncharacterized protein n=1 Tax=Diversispora epigaea TaxID=1348612 RepID=A0A397JKB6_9GLOM|nr:hypothetical protein Glove_51g50 [Diversispora epigaea]
MKYSYALVYLVVLIFSTCVFSHDKPNGEIHVTSPSKGPFVYSSYQAVTWTPNTEHVNDPYGPHSLCQVRVCLAGPKDEYGFYICKKAICTEYVPYGHGYYQFVVDHRFFLKTNYFAEVEFKQEHIYYKGQSCLFTVCK